MTIEEYIDNLEKFLEVLCTARDKLRYFNEEKNNLSPEIFNSIKSKMESKIKSELQILNRLNLE